jgi:serine/threonine protein kinase/cytochrome c-type biogenesis protein CcmH/NrfG
MALPLGTILDGKFKIVQILGEGGMGTVYKVEQIGTPPGTPPYYYAVKELLISPNTSEEDRRAAIDRFNKEIALLRGLKHPRIAALMLPFQERGNYYFVMEFVPGRSLETILEQARGPLPESQVIHWMAQVCEALSYIHTRTPPIILRDLKPGNIMISPDDEVQLIDFGIARRFDPNKRTNTENLGTISYASPEHLGSVTMPGQRRSAVNPGKLVQTDARSDIYSLGATMYHLLTNYEPDPIQTPPTGSVLAKNPRLRTVQAGNRTICPLEQVIIKAMQQNPAQRFQNAEAMRVALLQCLPQGAAPSTIQIPAISPNATIVVPSVNAAASASAGGIICPKCGFLNRAGAKFCKRDGQPLVQGASIAPPQIRVQSTIRPAIQPRPVPPQPIRARPIQANGATSRPVSRGIQARPVQVSSTAVRPTPIKARPVAVAAPSSDSMVAYRAGLQALSQKKFEDAIQQFKLAQNRGGPAYDVLYNLGRVYRQYGQSVREQDHKRFSEYLKQAAEYFEEALRQNPNAPDAQFQVGLCYRDLQLYPRAMMAFKKAQKMSPQDPAVYYQLGLIALEQGANRDADDYFKKGLEINPDHALLLIALGRLYTEMRNQLPLAIRTLQHAVKIDSTLWDAWYALGRAHIKEKEWNYALSALERARQINPDPAQIYSAMAVCFLNVKNKTEARLMLKEALSRDAQNAEALRLQKQL